MQSVLILGGDGYLGWPTAMHFSALGWDVTVVDNYLKRQTARELDCEALFPTPNLQQRCRLWEAQTGHKSMQCFIGDVTDFAFLSGVVANCKPDAVVHYAEQPSAPLSMLDRHQGAKTIQNNLISTFNVVHALREHAPDCHLIKLGTMGEYGTPNIDIEEGWLDIEHKGRKDRFLFPRQASSLYHTTKIQDTDMLWFYVRTWNLRVTDLMQGPVYGFLTPESETDDRLLPNFHYDEIYGTVLNRFIVQAVAGVPLTVYGSGKQVRGYLNLNDTLQCVEIAARNPSKAGEMRVYNQFTETFSVRQLAEMTKEVGDELGLQVTIGQKENPRVEREEHYYNPVHEELKALGLQPRFLTPEVMASMINKVAAHKERIQTNNIFRGVKW